LTAVSNGGLSAAAVSSSRMIVDDEFDEADKSTNEMEKPLITIASSPSNSSFNRYRNILAPDRTLVSLSNGQYINASFMRGGVDGKSLRFIGTQGAMKVTVEHFWRMLWENNVSVVVMLANVIEAGKVRRIVIQL
jgi:protein tyrosine phosphatase